MSNVDVVNGVSNHPTVAYVHAVPILYHRAPTTVVRDNVVLHQDVVMPEHQPPRDAMIFFSNVIVLHVVKNGISVSTVNHVVVVLVIIHAVVVVVAQQVVVVIHAHVLVMHAAVVVMAVRHVPIFLVLLPMDVLTFVQHSVMHVATVANQLQTAVLVTSVAMDAPIASYAIVKCTTSAHDTTPRHMPRYRLRLHHSRLHLLSSHHLCSIIYAQPNPC